MSLVPAMSTVPASTGPFTVYIVLQDLHHFGTITYDDDRDGTPDRSVQSNGLAAFQFTIVYNPSIVSVGSVQRGPDLDATGRAFQCLGPSSDQPDSVTFGCLSLGAQQGGVQGTLTLAAVQFVPHSSGLSALALDARVAGPLGDDAVVRTVGGAVRVLGAGSGTGVPTSIATQRPAATSGTANPSSTGTPVRTGTITAPGTETAIAPTGATAQMTATTQTPTPTRTATGSAGGDGNGGIWWAIGIGGAVGAVAVGAIAAMWVRRSRGG